MTNQRARFFESLKTRPAIAGLRDVAGVEAAIQHDVGGLFILGEGIFALQETVATAQQRRERGPLPPLIGGGLTRARARVDAILGAGGVGLSTSETSLWGYT